MRLNIPLTAVLSVAAVGAAAVLLAEEKVEHIGAP
jgi:hypothetical protein